MVSVEAWFGTSSSIFWATVVVIVLTVALVVIAVLTLRTAAARKSLSYTIISRTRLLDAPQSMRGKLQVVFADEPPLVDPYVTVIEIANTGKYSIASKLFDNDRGMVFNLGADIVEVLSVERSPESAPLPSIVSSGSSIELKPELIAAGEVIKASVLTRDKVKRIELILNPLSENFKISARDREISRRQQVRMQRLVISALAIVIVAEAVGIVIEVNHALNNATVALNFTISQAKNNACDGVSESSTDLTGDVVNQVAIASAGGFSKGGHSASAGIAYLNLQIANFDADTAEAAAFRINMKEAKPTAQAAQRLAAVFVELSKSKTLLEQKADLVQADALSLSVVKGVGGVMRECRPYL